MCRPIRTGSRYLSLPELSSDLHSVQVPSWVGASVVMSYPDFLNHIPYILQLGKEQRSTFLTLQPRASCSDGETTHLNDEHVFCPPLKVQTSLPLVDAQVLLLCAHTLLAIQHDEHVGVGSGAEHVAGENLDLVWYNWNKKETTGDLLSSQTLGILWIHLQFGGQTSPFD